MLEIREFSKSTARRMRILCWSQNVMLHPFWEADEEISCSGSNLHACFFSIISLECLSDFWCYWCKAFPDSSSMTAVTVSPRCRHTAKLTAPDSLSLRSVRHFICWNKATCALVVFVGMMTRINISRWDFFIGWVWWKARQGGKGILKGYCSIRLGLNDIFPTICLSKAFQFAPYQYCTTSLALCEREDDLRSLVLIWMIGISTKIWAVHFCHTADIIEVHIAD